ncbi:MAG: DUF3990 domain-containing protein [Bacteroidales bacterium]|nr:DUF3990 domain-containing protein [Bacteroidales bacterium]
MILYHGTNNDFDQIDIKKCHPNKDFGRGFYLSENKQHAYSMAERKCIFTEIGVPVVQSYSFDELLLNDGSLSVKIFDDVSVEWALFILENRKRASKHKYLYDIVKGPIADDGVVYQLNRYLDGMIDLDRLVLELKYKKLIHQYCFLTENAISKLKRL